MLTANAQKQSEKVSEYKCFLADVFENFCHKCIEMYELDPAYCLSTPGLAWQVCLEKTSRIGAANRF